AVREVLGVPPQIHQVLLRCHPRIRPRAAAGPGRRAGVLEPGRGLDVVDARRPRLVVTLVMLRPKWLQSGLLGDQLAADGDAVGDKDEGSVVASHSRRGARSRYRCWPGGW